MSTTPEKLDQCMGALMVNLYTLGKKKECIELHEFQFCDAHIALLGIALDCGKIYKWPVYVDCDLSTRRRLVREEHLRNWKRMPPRMRSHPDNWHNCNELITFVEDAFDVSGALTEIYKEYM